MATYNILIGNEVARTGPSLTQVYQATHDNGQYKSYMHRSFISFSYGGKNIEDFNLIATTDGDRLEREAYASFEDLTSTYDTIQGQFYWNTYFHTNSITFNLATDAITQRELDDFKMWFRAGQIKELILAEHPNRAIMARVANPPQLKLLPFETPAKVKFQELDNAVYYNTSTTLYRGEIILEMVMDEPFWYAKQNILGIQNTSKGYYADEWKDANGVKVQVKDSKDALKIIYEDHIPLGSTIQANVFLGGDIYASVEYQNYSKIVKKISKEIYDENINNAMLTELQKSAYIQEGDIYYVGARICADDNSPGGRIAGMHDDFSQTDQPIDGVTLEPSSEAYLYYAGNAPSPVKITFSLSPRFDENNYYIVSPYNKYSVTSGLSENPYNTISFTATKTHNFQFSLPTLYSSYNQVIRIFDDDNIMAKGNAWLIVRETIRDTVRHPIIRKWANKILDRYNGAGDRNGTIPSNDSKREQIRNDLKGGMQAIFLNSGSYVDIQDTLPAIFTFNGKTGQAVGHFVLRDPDAIDISLGYGDIINDNINISIVEKIKSQTEKNDEFSTIEIEENVGDMVKSSYLILDERNILNEYAQVVEWKEFTPEYSYLVKHDVPSGLQSVHFEFKNMYL